MVRKYCKTCGKKFEDDTNLFQCPDCRKWNDYVCNHPIQEKRNEPGNIHFAFSESWLSKKARELLDSSYYGSFQIDKKDKTHYAIFIHLYNFDIQDKELCKKICSVISHEFLHLAIYLSTDLETSKKADDWLIKKLEKDGYL